MEKVLVLGATGMAGHMIYHYLYQTGKYELANAVYRKKLTEDSFVVDVTDAAQVASTIQKVNPDVIINCIGILVSGARKSPAQAILINAYFPHLLKHWADIVGARLIHISTDCVFSGKKGNYTEKDFRDADDVYGRSKALGEIINEKDLTIRTSIIGPELKKEGEGLFHWFMHQCGKINGYKTAIWGGVTTLELAKAIDFAIMHREKGLIQLSNGNKISKYELLKLFQKIWDKKEIEIFPFDGNGIDKSIINSAHFHYQVPGYEEMLTELQVWMDSHRDLYTQYFD